MTNSMRRSSADDASFRLRGKRALFAALIDILALVLLGHPLGADAGPPFQTDDPEPVDLHHYEFYVFAASDGTPLETDSAGPAVEFNWGVLPNTQFHLVAFLGAIFPSDGPSAYGLLDTEIGVKYRFIQQSKYIPEVGIFPMIEVPTGNVDRGLGVGKTWYKLPIWIQKDFGPWTTYGGGGYQVVPQTGYKNFWYEGWLLQRDVGEKWTLGGEIFHHGAEGLATPQIKPATMLDFGGFHYFRKPGFQLLFNVGHTVIGQPEFYAYLGLYWTWGGSKEEGGKEEGAARHVAWSQAARAPEMGQAP